MSSPPPPTAAQALRVAGATRPDVVVLDLQLPDMSGVEVTRGLQWRTRRYAYSSFPRVANSKMSSTRESRRGWLPAEVRGAPGVP